MKDRRAFIKRATVAGTAAFLPLAGNARASQGDPEPDKHKVGHGDFVYQVDKDWGNLDPRKHPVQHCHEMVLDARGRLVCSSVASKHNVLVYNKDGKLLDSWNYELPEPHGLTKAGEGSDQTFWMTDSAAGKVINLDLDGRIIRTLEAPPASLLNGKAFKPTETTVAENGDVYVADGYGSNNIFHYDRLGRLKQAFGGPDHFNCCHGITVDDRGDEPSLLITSRAANEFQRWTLGGDWVNTYRLPGLSICRPVIHGETTYFAVLATKTWSEYDGMLAVLDKDMQVVSLPGGSKPRDQSDFTGITYDDRTFMNPHDVCVDDDLNLYVPQWYSGRTYPVRLRRI